VKKRTYDQRAVTLFLWVFGVVALGQLALHRLSAQRIDDHVARVESPAAIAHTAEQRRADARRALLADVRSDMTCASLITTVGLLLTVLGQRVVSHRLIGRLERERASIESASFARSIVDALPTHIAIIDRAGMVLAVNRSWREFAGGGGGGGASCVQRSAEGQNYLIACDEAVARGAPEAAAIGGAIRIVLAGHAPPAPFEYPCNRPGLRDPQWFAVTVTPFPADGDGPPRVVVAHEDITARKRAEEAMQRARDAAEGANQAKSNFLANMSHEIRTPMTAILGYADMLLDARQSPDERTKCIQTIRRNGEHLIGIINDILDISKIEADRMSAQRIDCDTRQVLADVVALTRARAVQKKLEFKVIADGRIPARINTDPLRLKQILTNLIGNAIKFTRRGHVLLRVSCEESLSSARVQFDICDTGIGMNEEQIARLFQPFTQADGSTTRRFGGTGLGLTISKRLAALLGGDISVRSTPGSGSTFSIWIDAGPVGQGVVMLESLDDLDAAATTEPAAPRVAAADVALAGRILLAEDGEDNQELLSVHLRRAGAEIVIACNGREAVDAVARPASAFDLVLMDMQMPELDGYEATRELRRQGYAKPIVALTAHATAEERPRCLAAGCTDFLSKPVTREELLEMAGRYLPRPPATQRPPAAASAAPAAASTAAAVPPKSVSTSPVGGAERLRSSHAANPKMREIIGKFVGRLPDRVSELERLLAAEDLEALRQAAHQLKGAAGGYGFGAITDAAARLEARIKTHDAFDSITAEVHELIALIARVEGYDAADDPDDPDGGRRRILLIDDDPAIHDLIRVSLASDPVQLHPAFDGAAALQLAASIKPDLILLDLELSSSHGFDVCRQLKQDASIASIPLIFITSASGTAEKIKGLNLGAVDYVTKPFDPGEVRARILAALRNKQLQDQLARNANVDVLTGAGNRRYFDQRAATELSRARRHGTPLSCVMLDIDHFKRINDTHGHPFGDEVLRRLGQLLTDTCRSEDIVCRYGGEEFVILAPGLRRDAAAALAERLRRAVAALELRAAAASDVVKITCSFGVAEVTPQTSSSAELVRDADKALYDAKHSGRNRVVCLEPAPVAAAAPA
jgi:diguanylate cyclase (GGDEF)-like protein